MVIVFLEKKSYSDNSLQKVTADIKIFIT